MSHINYDFLTESFLFREGYFKDNFKEYTDKELNAELERYREHVLSNIDRIRKEVTLDKRKINVTIEAFENRPSQDYLKQLVLYIDCVLIADPLFSLTEHKSKSSEVMSEYMGMQKHPEVDRDELVKALRYMKDSTPFIVCDFVKFLPTSLIHEAPRDIPIRYDENGFRDSLPKDIMSMLKGAMDVRNVKQSDGHLFVTFEEPLRKGTILYIGFPEIKYRSGEIVSYQKMELDGGINNDGRFKAKFYIPDNITNYEFSAWLEQSRNTAAKQLFDETVKEYAFACGFNSMYLTGSNLKAKILSSMWDNSSHADIANLSMRLKLPIIERADLETILDIRSKYGESFNNFRVSLGSELIKLRTVDDMDKLKEQLKDISFQINEVNVNSIGQEMRKIVQSMGVDGCILTGSLLTSCIANNAGSVAGNAMTMAGVASGAFVIANKARGDLKNLLAIRDKPEYFLWKLNKKPWKMK